jgi:DNA-binding XRE family transcriptional regulator
MRGKRTASKRSKPVTHSRQALDPPPAPSSIRIEVDPDAGLAREEAIRQHYDPAPSLKTMLKRGDIDEAEYQSAKRQKDAGAPPWPLRDLVFTLREERERQNLSLSDIAKRSQIDRAAINKIELGINRNPTVETLERYASALGKRISYVLRKSDRTRVSRSRKSRGTELR